MIKFDSVTKSYGSRTALDSITFRVDPGEFVFITGPSGAGKSTLAKLLNREILPTSGNLVVGEYDYSRLKQKDIPFLRRQIGVIYQDNKLLPDRTAAENIALSLEILNKADVTIAKTLEELLKVTGLEDKGGLFPHQLSGGELQRVLIARALAMDPPLLFADEPTGNLDTETARQIVELLERVNKAGTTVLMATHDRDIIKSLKKRIVTLKNGQLVSDTKKADQPEPKNTEAEDEPETKEPDEKPDQEVSGDKE